MNNIEEYQNLVSVLKHALEFYANTENYDVKHPINNVLFSQIEMDCGAQAKFALSKIEEVENNQKDLEKQFVADINNAFFENKSVDDTLKIIEEFKKVTDGDNKV